MARLIAPATTEFLMMGLLPEVAADFQISIPAPTSHLRLCARVVFGALLLTAASVRWQRRNVLIGLMVVFTAGNWSPRGVELRDAARRSCPDRAAPGAFFGIGSVVAAGMVGPTACHAISMMFAGLTVANVVGVRRHAAQPVWLARDVRVLAVIGVASVVAIALLVPQPAQAAPARLSQEIAAFGRAQVWLRWRWERSASRRLRRLQLHRAHDDERRGYSPKAVDLLLALFGLGMTVATWSAAASQTVLHAEPV